VNLIVGTDDGVGRTALQALGTADAEPLMDVRDHGRLVRNRGQIDTDTEQRGKVLGQRPPARRTERDSGLTIGHRRRRRRAPWIATLATLGTRQQGLDLPDDRTLLHLEIARSDTEQGTKGEPKGGQNEDCGNQVITSG
jgi:hypothetical protein